MISIGVLVLAWAVRALRRADTDLTFSEPTKVLVEQGPFGFSRNPIYLSFALIYLGIAISLNALWPILFFLVMLLVVQRGVIDREERYLERKFGEEYLRYKSRVRHWL